MNVKRFLNVALLVAVLLVTLGAPVLAQSDDGDAGGYPLPISGELLGKVAVAIFLATVAEFLVDGLIKPIFGKFGLDTFWLRYVAWAVASGIVALSGLNLFAGYIRSDMVGMILTAVFCGGGSNMIHDFFDRFLRKKKENASA